MADAVILSRQFVFGNGPMQKDQLPQGVVTMPIGVFVDDAAADRALQDAAQIHALAKGVIVFQGKPVMNVEQFLANLGIVAFGVVASKSRVREASLIVVPSGSV